MGKYIKNNRPLNTLGKRESLMEADDRYFSSKPSNDIKIKKFVREYADEIKDDIDNDMYDEYGMWSKYLDMFIMDFPKNKLATSDFAIKFFDEINKKFGTNFRYGYTKEGLNEYIEPFYDGSHAHDWFYKFLKDNDIKVKKATKFGEYDEYSGVAGGHTFKTYSYKPTNVITGPEGFLSGIEIDGVKIPHYVKGNNGSRELWDERHFSVKDVFDLCNNNLDIDKINKIVSWKDEWNKLLEPLMVDYDESLQESKNNIPEKANLKKILDRYESNGRFAKQGNWKIARGGYDLVFQLYYGDLAVIDGIRGTWDTYTRLEFDVKTYGANDEYNTNDLANYICQVYKYCKIEDNLKEDTVKQGNKWVNKGNTGKTHGEFKTKKQADAQRKAMFVNKKKNSNWGK